MRQAALVAAALLAALVTPRAAQARRAAFLDRLKAKGAPAPPPQLPPQPAPAPMRWRPPPAPAPPISQPPFPTHFGQSGAEAHQAAGVAAAPADPALATLAVLVTTLVFYFLVWRPRNRTNGTYRLREQVWVRDTPTESWRRGTVTDFDSDNNPIVRPDGWQGTSCHTWRYVSSRPEPHPPSNPEAAVFPAHAALGPVPGHAPLSLPKQYMQLSATMGHTSSALGIVGLDATDYTISASLPEKVKELESIDHEGLSQMLASLNETVAKHEQHDMQQQHDQPLVSFYTDSAHGDSLGLMSNGLESTGLSPYDSKTSGGRSNRGGTWGQRCLARLICVEGDGQDFEMRQPTIVLGRQSTGQTPKPGTPQLSSAAQGPDFVVGSDKRISRKHAMIQCLDPDAGEPTAFTLQCLGKNHVSVNGELHEPGGHCLELHSGDVLVIGNVRLRFQLASDQRGSPRMKAPYSPSIRADLSLVPSSRSASTLIPRRECNGPVLAKLKAVDDSSVFAIQREEIVIGRNCAHPVADCLLRPDRSVSRQHVRIFTEMGAASSFSGTTLHAGPSVRGMLEITQIHCNALRSTRGDGISNPAIQFCMGTPASAQRDRWHFSEHQSATVHPSFPDKFRLPVPAHPTQSECTLHLEVMHSDRPGAAGNTVSCLGRLALDLSAEFRGDWTERLDNTWPLSDPNERVPYSASTGRQRQERAAHDAGFGSVHLTVQFCPDEPMARPSLAAAGSRFWLECIGRNHAIVNGRTLMAQHGRQELRDNARITIGSVVFHFLNSQAIITEPSDTATTTTWLSPDIQHLLPQIFAFIDVDKSGSIDEDKLRSFAKLHHDPEAVTSRALNGVLVEILDFARTLNLQQFIEWFSSQSSLRVDEIMDIFRSKWSDDWSTGSARGRYRDHQSRPPDVATISDIRSALTTLVAASHGASNSMQSGKQDRIGRLMEAADRKLRDGVHPNHMLEWCAVCKIDQR
jgi:hypothetical protein